MSLDKGEVFVSGLDLNVENEIMENRGTEENPKYVPVIRYATPVFSDKGEPRGIVISNVYADYFLDDIRNFQREGEATFLIANDGYYLAHPEKAKEFAFMFDNKDDNFAKDYPEVADRIMENCSKRRIETDDSIFTYRCIYPMASSFGIYEGSKKFTGDKDNDYWILVTATDKNEVQKTFIDFNSKYLWFGLSYGLTILVVIGLVFLLAFKRKSDETR